MKSARSEYDFRHPIHFWPGQIYTGLTKYDLRGTTMETKRIRFNQAAQLRRRAIGIAAAALLLQGCGGDAGVSPAAAPTVLAASTASVQSAHASPNAAAAQAAHATRATG